MQTKDLIEKGRYLIDNSEKMSTEDEELANYIFKTDYLPTILDRLENRTKACEFYADPSNFQDIGDCIEVNLVLCECEFLQFGTTAREALDDEGE